MDLLVHSGILITLAYSFILKFLFYIGKKKKKIITNKHLYITEDKLVETC